MRKACLCTNELFRATHNTVTVLDASIHRAGVTPKDEGPRRTILEDRGTCVDLSTCRIYLTAWQSESIPHRGQRPYSIW